MQDRVVIITGGGTGIGRATAMQFAQTGAWVVVVGRRAAPLEEAASVSERIVNPEARWITGQVLAVDGGLSIA